MVLDLDQNVEGAQKVLRRCLEGAQKVFCETLWRDFNCPWLLGYVNVHVKAMLYVYKKVRDIVLHTCLAAQVSRHCILSSVVQSSSSLLTEHSFKSSKRLFP